MKGFINEYGEAVINVVIIGSRKKVSIEGMIDTGFDGDICLPVLIAIQLGLELRDMICVELADGTKQDELVFEGRIIYNGEEKLIKILLTNSQQTLIGTGLLQDKVLEIDFVKKIVEIRQG